MSNLGSKITSQMQVLKKKYAAPKPAKPEDEDDESNNSAWGKIKDLLSTKRSK